MWHMIFICKCVPVFAWIFKCIPEWGIINHRSTSVSIVYETSVLCILLVEYLRKKEYNIDVKLFDYEKTERERGTRYGYD